MTMQEATTLVSAERAKRAGRDLGVGYTRSSGEWAGWRGMRRPLVSYDEHGNVVIRRDAFKVHR